MHLYLYGEAHDDLRSAFYIDEQAYPEPELAAMALEIADAALSRLGIIYSVEVSAGRPHGVPTWEEFRRRHIVEGQPLPVRPRPRRRVVPPSWDAMSRAVTAGHEALRDELARSFAEAFPAGRVQIEADRGPLRRSPASVDWSEEKYGFEISWRIGTGDATPAGALDRLAAVLRKRGWEPGEPATGPSGLVMEATREAYRLWTNAQPGFVSVQATSPLYRAPAEPGSTFVTEPRRPPAP